jgi:hypothetical protein
MSFPLSKSYPSVGNRWRRFDSPSTKLISKYKNEEKKVKRNGSFKEGMGLLQGYGNGTSGFGGESWNWIKPILAFSILVGPPAFLMTGWLRTNPSTSSVSSIVPPTFFTIRISFKSTFSAVAGTITLITASTAIGANNDEYWETILELRDVEAARRSEALSVRVIFVAISERCSTPFAAAFWKASAMIVGWIPIKSQLIAEKKRRGLRG